MLWNYVVVLICLWPSCQGFVACPTNPDSIAARQALFQSLPTESSSSSSSSLNPPSLVRDEKVAKVLQQARSLGPVGSLRTEEERESLLALAKTVADASDQNPARLPLSGVHQLVYSASPGGSSGKVGPFVGQVTQEFVDDVTFINAVTLGPLQIALRAERQVKNDTTIKVTFCETTVSLFGNVVTRKSIENSGGVWKYLFSGKITMPNGKQKLVRIMETPSLFVLEQDLD